MCNAFMKVIEKSYTGSTLSRHIKYTAKIYRAGRYESGLR